MMKAAVFAGLLALASAEVSTDPMMSSFLQYEASAFLESAQMTSVQITAEGRVGMTGVEEEGTEEQGAAQAAELLKMYDVHVGHIGSAPNSLASFIQTHDTLTEQQREAAQAKAVLQRRVSKAMSKSAQIDKLLDDAVMESLSDPKEVEQKPSLLEEIAGAFRSNQDPLKKFYEHPFILRYRSDQKHAVMPPRPIQQQLVDSLLKDAPANMKMAVIHADLDAPDSSELNRILKIQKDVTCINKIVDAMPRGDDGELRVFIDVQGGRSSSHDRVANEIERALDKASSEKKQKILSLKKLGDQQTQDYATGLADFVFRLGESQLADSKNIDLAAFKTEALRRGGVVKFENDQCSLDNENVVAATSKASKKFKAINKASALIEKKTKEYKMLSETEQWAAQQRRVEHNHKRHGKASVDVDFKPSEILQGFANLLKKGTRTEKQAAKAAQYDTSATPRNRRANHGLYKP